jgi:hypothetical protein
MFNTNLTELCLLLTSTIPSASTQMITQIQAQWSVPQTCLSRHLHHGKIQLNLLIIQNIDELHPKMNITKYMANN